MPIPRSHVIKRENEKAQHTAIVAKKKIINNKQRRLETVDVVIFNI